MKFRHRLLALLLCLVLACPSFPAALAAETGDVPAALAAAQPDPVTGSITATVRVDYAQRLDELERRDLRVELARGQTSLGAVPLYRPGETALTGCTARVSAQNAEGGDLAGGQWPSALTVAFSGLSRGEYTLTFTGQGYRRFTQSVTLSDCSQHLTLGTGDATLTLGDVTGDGRVDQSDRSAYSTVLGSTRAQDLLTYDLNGDGAIDIVDLAYVDRLMVAARGSAAQDVRLQSTVLLAPGADLTAAQTELAKLGATVQGDLADLFRDNGQTVTLTADHGELTLPLPLKSPVEMTAVDVVTPDGDGRLLAGVITVEDASGNATTHPFDHTLPATVHATPAEDGRAVIRVELGRRVAVKKVTITVTKTAAGGYAAVESVQFLRDIVPDLPVAPNSVVKRVTATAKSEAVDLVWTELPNVSGYKVLYWPEASAQLAQELHVDVTRATVPGLKNLEPYVFTVTPTDGSWEGRPSDPVTATPQPDKVPDKVDMLQLTAQDGSIAAGWKQGKSATYYRLFYKPETAAQWTQLPGDLTQTHATITGLTNDVTYQVYVVAFNDVGKGPASDVSQATPKAVRYQRPEGIPTAGVLPRDKIASVALADPGNYRSGEYTADAPFTPDNIMDDDYRTHWTAQNWWRNEHVVTTFTQPVDLQAAVWVPRLDGSYPSNLRAYSVRVWYEGESLTSPGHLIVPDSARGGVDNGGTGRDVDTWPAVRGNCPVTNFAILPFGPAEKVIRVSVAVEQRNYLTVSLSELLFLEYDPAHCLPTEISALFADELHTALVPGVTAAQVDALAARLNSDEKNYYVDLNTLADELDLARELLAGRPTSGVLRDRLQSRDGGEDSRKYAQGGSVLQPLGVAAAARQELTVYATGIPAGQSVTVYASQFNAEASAWLKEVGKLENGRNILSVPAIGSRVGNNGGSLYVAYSGPDPENIRLHIRRGTAMPILELSDWYERSEAQRREAIGAYVDALGTYTASTTIAAPATDYRNVTELSTPVVLLSLPALAVNNALGKGSREEKITTLYNAVLAWEDIMAICKRTQGIDRVYEANDMRTRQNIRCMTMFAGAFMYAAGNHIGIGYGSCGGMVTGRPIAQLGANATANQLFGWGIAHEIGHNMDKLGRAEITNNIYSILVQTYDGARGTLPSRLEKSGKYPAIFTKVAQGYPGASNDVFVQLGLYYQLHLAYSGEDPLDFYNRFFKAWKAGTYTAGATAYDDRLALTAAGVANADLTEFCTRWGMTLSPETLSRLTAYPAESRAVWYLSDASRRARLAGQTPAAGAVKAAASKVSGQDNAIRVSLDASAIQGGLQGFEIIRNGRPIAFVSAGESAYTDVIGSGNHRTYRYQVAAYDLLGNRVGPVADAGEVRVAYDKTVDTSAYTVTPSKGKVTVTFREETSVSGLKLLNFQPSGAAVTVTVTTASGPVQALTTTLDGGHNLAADDKTAFVSYFRMPGAGETDTRIWTYDARTVTITGLPDGFSASDLRFISYPGDDVAFLEGATMGLLRADYTYDTAGGKETIPAGTLVILGTYRGDPVYNILHVEGRFTATATQADGSVQELDPVERPLAGYAFLFAQVPETGPVCDMSDGLFLFVPDVQREAQLQDAASHCDAQSLLPSQIRVSLYRTDDPDDANSKRLTAQTLWLHSPGGEDLPWVELTGEEGT